MMQRRRVIASAVAAASLNRWTPAAFGASIQPLPALTADSFRASGQRGVGFGLLRFGNRSNGDHDSLRALGAQHVRVFIEPKRERNADGYQIPPPQLLALDAMLDSLEQRGMYMVLVASLGADARGELWRKSALQASVVQIWTQLAQRLRGRSAIAAFDVVNEPVPPGLTFAAREDRWLEFALTLVRAVRAVDPSRVLIIESAPDATPESFENLHALPVQGLVYSVHSYRPMEFTHQGVMKEYATPRRYPEVGPDGKSTAQVLIESLEHVVRFMRRHDVPIYVGEFSAPRWAPDGSAARYVADSISLFNRYGWSWSYHEYRAWHGWDAEIGASESDARQRSNVSPVLLALRDGLRAAKR